MSANRLNRNQLIIENDRLNKRIAELEEMLAIKSASVTEKSVEIVKDSRDPNKVSVIMPNFNCSELLERAIKSVLNQTYKNFELIIVDDNSTDNSLKVICKFAAHDSRIRVYKNVEQRGTYWSKNAVLDKTTGSFITILDADDYDVPTKLEKQVKAFNDKSINCVTCLCDRKVSEWSNISERVSMGYASMMFRYSVFTNLGYYDTVRFGADSELFERFKRVYGQGSVFHINEVLQIASRRANGLTSIIPGGSNPRMHYVQHFRHWHRTSRRLKMDFPSRQRPYPVSPENTIEYADLTNIKAVEVKGEGYTWNILDI
jgi:glycosyltransferase involved in cell wall biosynthesis